MSRGKFVVIEGLDGSGKTTLIHDLCDVFYYNRPVVVAEPSIHSVYYDTIRAILSGHLFQNVPDKDRSSMLAGLFSQNRDDHIRNRIVPSLEVSELVLCDRYLPSSLVYQAANDQERQQVMRLNKDVLIPDLTIILDTPPEVCAERIDSRGDEREIYERLFHEHRRRYLEVSRNLSDIGWRIHIANMEEDTPETLADLITAL